MRRRLTFLLIAIAIAIVAFAIVRSGDDEPAAPIPTAEEEPPCDQYNPVDATAIEVPPPPESPPEGELTARVRTNCGDFEIALDSERAPRTVASFAHLARVGAYEGTGFHRIEPGVLIEGGDPDFTGEGGPGYVVVEEPRIGRGYRRGDVAMVNPRVDVPGLSGSAFFVVLSSQTSLPPLYARVGTVSEGYGTVRAIERLSDPTGALEEPIVPVHILRVTIERGGAASGR